MAPYIDGIDLGRKYTIIEVTDLFKQGRLRKVGFQGYVVRANSDGTVEFVHWTRSTANRQTPGSQNPDGSSFEGLRTYAQTDGSWHDDATEAVEQEFPMHRRTPQERVDAMTRRLMSEVGKTGMTGLPDDLIKGVVGESWKRGEPISAEVARKVAAHFLGTAEVDNREADSHRTTRKHQYA